MTTTRTTTGMLHAIQHTTTTTIEMARKTQHKTRIENDDDNAPNDDVGVPDNAGRGTVGGAYLVHFWWQAH